MIKAHPTRLRVIFIKHKKKNKTERLGMRPTMIKRLRMAKRDQVRDSGGRVGVGGAGLCTQYGYVME